MLPTHLLKVVFISFTLASIVSTSSIAQGSMKSSLLIHYSSSGNLFMVKLLLKKGANPNFFNKKYNVAFIANTNSHRLRLQGKRHGTALIAAVKNNHIKVVKALVEAGADPNIRDLSGDTALTIAAGHGDNIYLVQILVLDAQASIDIQNRLGYTSLMKTVMNSHKGVVRALLDLGANPNIQDSFGRSPLMMAVKHKNADIVQMLLAAGGDPNCVKYNILDCPIMQASRDGNKEIIKMLSEAGAALDIRDKSGQTPLMVAIKHNHVDAVQVLLEKGADFKCKKYSTDNCPLIQASRDGRREIVRVLLRAGADPDVQDKYGYTPLMMTTKRRDIFFMLLGAGADPQVKNKYGETALKMIVYSNSRIHDPPVYLVQALLDAGASPIIEGEYGRLEVLIEDTECGDALSN